MKYIIVENENKGKFVNAANTLGLIFNTPPYSCKDDGFIVQMDEDEFARFRGKFPDYQSWAIPIAECEIVDFDSIQWVVKGGEKCF